MIDKLKKMLQNLEKQKQYYLDNLFPAEGKDIPKLRFKEFKEKWKKNLLGNIAVWNNGNNFSKDDLLPSGFYPAIHYSELYTKYHGYIHKTNYINLLPKNQKFAHKGDTLLPKTTTSGTGWGLIEPSTVLIKKIAVGSDIIIISSNTGINFLNFLLRNSILRNKIASTATGATGIMHLNVKQIKNIETFIPTIEEQEKIAKFLAKIDGIIERERC